MYERNIVEKAKENPKLFHISIKNIFSNKEQIIKLKDSDGRVLKAKDEICKELHPKFQCVFKTEDTAPKTGGKFSFLDKIQV